MAAKAPPIPQGSESRYSNVHFVGILESQFPTWFVQEEACEYTVPELLAFWRQANGESLGPRVWYRWTDKDEIEVFEDDGTMSTKRRLALLTPTSREVRAQ